VVIYPLTTVRIAGIAAFFESAQKQTGRRLSGSPHETVPKPGFQPSEEIRLDSRETFRAAVFLWITPRATPRAISGCTFFIPSAASALLPEAIADSTALMKLLMRLIREWLIAARFALRRIRFLACGVFAMTFL
jgi:hypothetical protein